MPRFKSLLLCNSDCVLEKLKLESKRRPRRPPAETQQARELTRWPRHSIFFGASVRERKLRISRYFIPAGRRGWERHASIGRRRATLSVLGPSRFSSGL